MRVAALYDVHGNLPALEAVLGDPRCRAADAIVSGGDLVAGPLPAECLDLLEEEGERVRFLRGNCDREAVSPESEDDAFRASSLWCAERLGPERLRRVAAWPMTVELAVEGLGAVLFCHATPSSDTRIVTRETPEAEVARELGRATATLIVCGHTHVQFDRTVAAVRLVNAGSVGMPYEDTTDARWALVGPDGVELASTPYDAKAALERLAKPSLPAYDDWFAAPLRGQITSDEATAQFESRRRGA
jgi:predicted phosphodiesterase